MSDNDYALDLWRTVSPLSDPEEALDGICRKLRFKSASFEKDGKTQVEGADCFAWTILDGVLSVTFDSHSVRDPAVLQEVVGIFRVVLERHREFRELVHLREAAEAEKMAALARLGRKEIGDEIVGREQGLRYVLERVEQVATSDLPVLIVGETGTGKELVARTIHQRSGRSRNPFHRVNCGAIPPELVDSQLFGHERGSFTGATDQRKGWFERADGGTLFLDEIGELPLAAQVRFLRILQDGHYERVGGQKTIHCDVRIVAATNRDLAQMVAEGHFRDDLWYRIAVFPIRIPPLRERIEDIPDLAEHFATRAATRFGLSLAHPTKEDLHRLTNYAWPGNVREFGSVVDRAAILGNGKRLDIAAALGFPSELRSMEKSVADDFNASPSGSESGKSSTEPFEDAVKRHIEEALKTSHGRVNGPFGAAKRLGLNPNTLRSKMRKLGIDPRQFK